MKLRTSFYKFCLVLFLTVLLQWLLFPFLKKDLEYTHFFWSWFESEKESFLLTGGSGEPKPLVLLLGDSQAMSGLSEKSLALLTSGFHPSSQPFSEKYRQSLRWARPSEQPEGILTQLLLFFKLKDEAAKKFSATIILNISPISLSQNEVTEAHRWLVLKQANLHSGYFSESLLARAYGKEPWDLVFGFASRLFPLLRLNSEGSKQMQNYLFNGQPGLGPTENEFFSKLSVAEKLGGTWRDPEELKTLPQDAQLPPGLGLAFQKERKLSIQLWERIFELLKEKNSSCMVLDIPFSPVLEKDLENSGVRKVFLKQFDLFQKSSNCHFISVPRDVLDSPELFADFTHLNQKGRIQLERWISKRNNASGDGRKE